jgi:hypothetical protein
MGGRSQSPAQPPSGPETPSKRLADLFKQIVRENDRRDWEAERRLVRSVMNSDHMRDRATRCRADAETIGQPATKALLIEMAEMWERLGVVKV